MLFQKVIMDNTIPITDPSNTCPIPEGILLIIGGAEDKGQKDEVEEKKGEHGEEILKTFLQLTGKETPVIEVVTSASSEPDEMIADYKKVFGELGINDVGHIHHNTRKDVLETDLGDRLQNADAFFFTGGDQLMLTSIYGGSRLLTVLKERYIKDKVVIAGTSAGAMALSTPMIFAGNKQVQQIAGEIKITMGLEFMKDVCIDTHFIDRSRFVRMAQVIATNPTCIGIGIEEDTAIIVREGSKVEVIGTGLITIIEGFFITGSNIVEFSEGSPISIQDLRVHLLPKGGVYEIQLTNPPHK
jgi:cyanophycinase